MLVRSRRFCELHEDPAILGECKQSVVRRTVWSEDRELWEIQMPDGAHAENDTLPMPMSRISEWFDGNPLYGRLAYTYGPEVDRPLSVTRVNYQDRPMGRAWSVWEPFPIVPVWNARGAPDNGYFAQSGARHHLPGDTARKVLLDWPLNWEAYGITGLVRPYWHGTLLEDKQDRTQTNHRRNRYYDPATGRFTQEDPIGLAGGLNLYGYANGDPVSYSDPFGLSSCTIILGRPICLPPVVVQSTGRALAGASSVVAAGAATLSLSGSSGRHEWRTHITYTLRNSEGRVYAGRASGMGTPEAVLAQRWAGHHMRLLGYGDPQPDEPALGVEGGWAIRGREQQLIDHHGGARRDGGSAANLIRGVSKRNRNGREYHRRANELFGGELHPYTGNR